jgi:hypothetical protein
VAGIERLHQESFVDESAISLVAYIRFWRRFIELANGLPFDAAQLAEYLRFDRWLFGLLLGSTADERWQIGLRLLR